MALPPGATGSAVTGIQTSMVIETCKARFCGDVSNSNPCDFVLNSVSCRHPNEMKIQAPHGFARLLRTTSLAGSLLTCAFLIVPSVLAGPATRASGRAGSGSPACSPKNLMGNADGAPQSSPCPPCGPLYCKDPVATERAREAKKARMRAEGYPERLLKLLDQYMCVACVIYAPDTFTIMIEYVPGSGPSNGHGGTWTHESFQWTPQEEAISRKELREGKIKAFYIMNAGQACKCCGEKDPSERPDWNSTLEMNTGGMLVFDGPQALGPDPPEVQQVPPEWLQQVPQVGSYVKPPKRQAHVICPACQPLADALNSIAETLDYLWDEKVRLQRSLDVGNRAIIERQNQIAQLQYQQLMHPQPGVDQQIEDLSKVNAAQTEDINRDLRKLADLNSQIAQAEAGEKAAEAKLVQCEQTACKQPSYATPPATSTTPTLPPSTPVSPPPTAAPQVPTPGAGGASGTPGNTTVPGTPAPASSDVTAADVQNAINQSGFGRKPETPGTTLTPSPSTPTHAPTGPATSNTSTGPAGTAPGGNNVTGTGGTTTTGTNAGGAPAQPQVGQQSSTPFTCSASVAVPPLLRSEGLTELVGDITLSCTGGSPPPNATITLQLNNFAVKQAHVFLINPTIPGQAPVPGTPNGNPPPNPAPSEAVLLIDEPGSGLPGYGPSVPSQHIPTVAVTNPGQIGVDNPVIPGQVPVPGTITVSNATAFHIENGLMVPGPGPLTGAAATRVFRITNVRANVSGPSEGSPPPVPPSGTSGLPGITLQGITITGPPGVPITCGQAPSQNTTGIPRFQDSGTGVSTQTSITICRTVLLYPFVTNQAGFDTGLAISNTSTDPFGTTAGAPLTIYETLYADPFSVESASVPLVASYPGHAAGNNAIGTGPVAGVITPLDYLLGATNSAITGILTSPNQNVGLSFPLFPGPTPDPWNTRVAPRDSNSHFASTAPRSGGRIRLATFRTSEPLLAFSPRAVMRLLADEESQAKTPGEIIYSLVANGNSSGQALELQVFDPSGAVQEKDMQLPEGVVLEPVKPGSAKPVSETARGGNILTKPLTAYCVDYAKLSPEAGMLYRIAPQPVQDRYGQIRFVMQAGRELAAAGKFHPDSDAAAYNDSIRQYSLWAKIENWDEQKFGQVFLEKTTANALAAKVKWTKQMDQAVSGLVPGRWRDISMVLDEAAKLSSGPQAQGPGPRQ